MPQWGQFFASRCSSFRVKRTLPSQYGQLKVRAVRTRAGMIDWSDRAKIRLTGSERVTFLDGIVTADMKILTPGTSANALLLQEKVRVLGDLRVYAFADSLVLDIEASQKDTIMAILEKARVSDDVEFHDLGACGHIEVHGPASGDLITGVLPVDARGLPQDAFLTFAVDKHSEGHLGRVPGLGEIGYAIWSPASSLEEIWDALSRREVTPIGRDAFEVLRIEVGTPRFGMEMGEDTLALEVAPEFALSFTKGGSVGQEVVARGTYVGQVRRKLFGLRVDADVAPVHGGKGSKRTREVGKVTSGTWSPTTGWGIAIALLRADEVSAKERLFVDRGGWDLRAQLHSLPFVRRGA